MVTEYGGVLPKIQLEVQQVSCFYHDSVRLLHGLHVRQKYYVNSIFI
jgi:hypothetical protein